jgi:hypothetical protein
MAFTVAIMQPYFLPYAGYFRLLSQSDLFVIYDCVQFPRRGWVHRNRVRDRSGELRWLTLPLAYAPQDTRIDALAFADDASAQMAERLAPFDLDRPELADLLDLLRRPEGRAVDYIVAVMEAVCQRLDIPWRTVRSSTLDVSPELRGQDRILEIARRLGAERYLNAPGGRDLYDPVAFADAGVELSFLPTYDGPSDSILQRLSDEGAGPLRAEFATAAAA